MNYPDIISSRTGIAAKQVDATIRLLDDKATIPFIARYRKERTGGLDEVEIASINEEYARLRELEERKKTVIRSIEEQGKMSNQLRRRIDECTDNAELEDIYLPYKPHRKTRADVAREHGLQPLADMLMRQQYGRLTATESDLEGARDIIAETVAQDTRARQAVRREFTYSATLTTKPVKEKEDTPEAQNYRDYFAVNEPLRRISSHRLLAIRRAEKEGFLRADISPDKEKCIEKLCSLFVKNGSEAAHQVQAAVEDSYRRLLKPAIETEFAALSKERADTAAIQIFAQNLRQLLMDSPLGQKRVIAIDPGFRTGCKTVVLSAQGDLLRHEVLHLRMMNSARLLCELIRQYATEAIAIGNGTASRETEEFVRTVIAGIEADKRPQVFVVSENGASVYSASQTAREEFPDEDVTVRGAVSIGRRLMDPLAELVKIDPKSIGVGQYQHDVDQKRLRESLEQTVESVVNQVGVDVNTASRYLLTYISGVGPSLAQNIVDYRSANGPFSSREQLKKVPKLGAKTFEQAAGFLRVSGSGNPLDNSAVHPERYALVERMARDAGCTLAELIQDKQKREQIDIEKYVSDEAGLPTLTDIMHELEKPGRDPRTQAEEFSFDNSVHTIDDLREGMELPGIVTNIAAFGVFVDIGVHKDGLVHISQLADRRVSSPDEVVRLHQKVRVRVLEVEHDRGRIKLTMRGINK
ncbi:MAG: RNA-binding transcriptional accessory protein [Paludibacteraceae bacterium]|nr:RNA-binding transcriptional accessory protein [Paludibacteraceae bacterium]